MARKVFEKTQQPITVRTSVEPLRRSYETISQVAATENKSLQEFLRVGRDLSFGEFKKQAAINAQKRIVENDPYVEYYNTKGKKGLEDRLTNEGTLIEIEDDYLTKLEINTEKLYVESLAQELPSSEFNSALDITQENVYQEFRKTRLDSPQLELNARETINPYIRGLKRKYLKDLLAQKKTNLAKGQKSLLLRKAKYAGLFSFTDKAEETQTNLTEYLQQFPLLYQKHALEVQNAYQDGQFLGLQEEVGTDNLKNNSLSELQIKYDAINKYELNHENANVETTIAKQKVLKNILAQANLLPEIAEGMADDRIKMNNTEFLNTYKDKVAPEALSMMFLIDSNLDYLTMDNVHDFIRLHNKEIYPMNVTVREPDGTISPVVDIDVPFFRKASEKSLLAYAKKRITQYKQDQTTVVETLLNSKSSIFDANGVKQKEVAAQRLAMGVPVLTRGEVTTFIQDIKENQSREGALQDVQSFFGQFTLDELSTLSYPMLTKLDDKTRPEFFLYLNAALQDKITDGEKDVLTTIFRGNEQIKNAGLRTLKDNETTNDTTLQNLITEYVETHVTPEMTFAGSKPLTVSAISNGMRAYIYGNQSIAYGDDVTDDDLIKNAFEALTGYKEDTRTQEQINGYGNIGSMDSIIHLREADRADVFSDVPVGFDSMNEAFSMMDTPFMENYFYYIDPTDNRIKKLEGGVSTIYAPLMGKITHEQWLTQIEPGAKEINFKAEHARDFVVKNAKGNSDFFTFRDADKVLTIDINGRPVEVMIDLKALTYDYKKYVEPNLQFVSGVIVDDDVLIEKGYVNLGPGTIREATYTRRFLLRNPRKGDILVSPTGDRFVYDADQDTTGMVGNMYEVYQRAKEIERLGGTSFGAMEFGTKFQDFFGENE